MNLWTSCILSQNGNTFLSCLFLPYWSVLVLSKLLNQLSTHCWIKNECMISNSYSKGHCVALNEWQLYIMLECPCNVDRLTPQYYILKLGVTGGIHYFLIFALKHISWVLVRTASMSPTIYVLGKKNQLNIVIFTTVKIALYCIDVLS